MLKSGRRLLYTGVLILFYLNSLKCIPIESNLEIVKSNTKFAAELTVLKREIIHLQERVTKLEKDTGGKEHGLIYKVENDETVEHPTVHLLNKRAVVRRRLRRVPEVAFQASLSKEYETFDLYDAIIFNDIITNIGGAYNKHTGIFTAPVSGTYTFNTNLVSEKGHYVEAAIQVNDKATVSAISDHRLSPNTDYLDIWDQGNAVAVLSLRKGDKVSVTIQWPQGSHDIHGVGKSSFSGYLLRAH